MNSFWENVFGVWERYYYGEPIWFCSMIFCLGVGIKFYIKEKSHFLFIAYAIAGILIFLYPAIYVTGYQIKDPAASIILETGNVIFSALEITIFYTFFFSIIDNGFTKGLMKLCLGSFILLCFWFMFLLLNDEFSRPKIVKLSFQINVIEFFLLLIPCFVRFYEFFTNEIKTTRIATSPSLWIINGLFFYVSTSLPFLLIGNIIVTKNQTMSEILYSVHYVSISVLFLCITKAFSCRTSLIA